MSFARRLLAPAVVGALAVAATALMTGSASAAEPGSVTCNGNNYDATYGQNHVSGDNADCGAWARSAQEYGMNIARQYGAPVG